MSTQQLDLFGPRRTHDGVTLRREYVTQGSEPKAKAYGTLSREERGRLTVHNNSIMAEVILWFEANPGPITAVHLGERLGRRVENCLAPRLSELVRSGWLVKSEERVHGGRGVVRVHEYRRNLPDTEEKSR